MAKKRKIILGAVIKGRDGKPDYIKVNGDHLVKDGMYLNLDTRTSQLESLNAAVMNGKLQEETAAKIRETIEKVPWYTPPTEKEPAKGFVRFQISALIEE